MGNQHCKVRRLYVVMLQGAEGKFFECPYRNLEGLIALHLYKMHPVPDRL